MVNLKYEKRSQFYLLRKSVNNLWLANLDFKVYSLKLVGVFVRKRVAFTIDFFV